ncbi:hypothetical protein DVH05_001937 [Phytophthora capsici]|nr:hypothetical protein DVH05_001937 [Phytophthora capsici]
MTVRNGDVGALKWLAERYAPASSMTNTAVVAAVEGQLEVLQWLYQNHNDRVHWGGAEWCGAVLSGHKSVVQWLRTHVKPHAEAAPQLLLASARTGDLELVQWLHKNYELPVPNALVEAQQGRQWGIVKWILMLDEVEDPNISLNIITEDGSLDFLQWIYAQGFGQPTTHALAFERSRMATSWTFQV